MAEDGKTTELTFLHGICQSKWGIRGAVNVYNNAINNDRSASHPSTGVCVRLLQLHPVPASGDGTAFRQNQHSDIVGGPVERYVASVSWGKDSLAMLWLLLGKNYPLHEVVFYDTGMEFQAIYNLKLSCAIARFSRLVSSAAIPIYRLHCFA